MTPEHKAAALLAKRMVPKNCKLFDFKRIEGAQPHWELSVRTHSGDYYGVLKWRDGASTDDLAEEARGLAKVMRGKP